MEKPLVTIVLPIYNVEKYLERCINSVVNQTYANLEILLIDDASPDCCPHLCDEWAQKDCRVKVIHKPINEGLGMARNTGIENATGEYIFFFDSDDYVALDVVEKCVCEAKRTGAEIVSFGAYFVDADGNVTGSRIPFVEQKYFEGREVQEKFLPNLLAPSPAIKKAPVFCMTAWSAMYKINLLQEKRWYFISEREIISEDVYSLMSLYQHVQCVGLLSEGLYYYCTNETSLTHTYRKDRYEKVKDFYLRLLKLCKEAGYNQDIMHRASKPYMSFAVTALKQEARAPHSLKECRKRVYAILKDPMLQQVLQQNKYDQVSKTRKMMYFLMRNRLYWLCFLILRLKK